MLTNIQRISTETQTDFETSLKNDKIDIKEKIKQFFRKLTTIIIKNLMLILIIIAAAIGIGLGFSLRPMNLSASSKMYFSFPGELFVRGLRFLTLPLYLCNLITGMSRLVNKTKRIAVVAILFYCISIISALLISFLLVLTIKPGFFRLNIINRFIYINFSQQKVISIRYPNLLQTQFLY